MVVYLYYILQSDISRLSGAVFGLFGLAAPDAGNGLRNGFVLFKISMVLSDDTVYQCGVPEKKA